MRVAASDSAENLPDLLNADGVPFSDELEELRGLLARLPNDQRTVYRNRNAASIAGHSCTHLLIVAGPGAGKSYLFLSRIQFWIAAHENPAIYVASFVNKLVADLRAEIARDIPDEDANKITATTLHSLARSLIERNGGGGGLALNPHVRVLPDPWDDVVWRDSKAFHPDIQGDFGIRPMRFQFYGDMPSEDPQWRQLLATYDQLRVFYNAVGFADMIVTAKAAVEENGELIEHDFWIFDEFQDFNAAEAALVAAVTRKAAGVLIAGDDEQALYETLKGGLPETIVGHYGDPRFAKAMLPYCSRCSDYICRAASAFMDAHRREEGIPKVFIPLVHDPDAAKVQVVATAVPSSAVDYVKSFLEDHQDDLAAHQQAMKDGTETDPFLLILAGSKKLNFFKTKAADQQLFDLLNEWSTEQPKRSDDYWKLAAYCAAHWYPANNLGMRKVLRYESVSYANVHELIVDALDRGVPLCEATGGVVEKARDKCRSLAEVMESDELEPTEKAARCAEALDIANPDKLAAELATTPIQQSGTQDEGDEATEPAPMAPVELLSMVGAKGLSAKHVIVLGCDNVNMRVTPLVFYVALTRARDSLHLIASGQAGGATGPHDYLSELPNQCCEYSVHKKSGVDHLAGHAELQQRFETWARVKRGGRRT